MVEPCLVMIISITRVVVIGVLVLRWVVFVVVHIMVWCVVVHDVVMVAIVGVVSPLAMVLIMIVIMPNCVTVVGIVMDWVEVCL